MHDFSARDSARDRATPAQPDFAARQTFALEYIALRIDELVRKSGQSFDAPLEDLSQFELARRRLLEEAI